MVKKKIKKIKIEKRDIFIMIYQFFGSSLLFLVLIFSYLDQFPILGKVIYNLDYSSNAPQITWNGLLSRMIMVLGVFGMLIQRKLYKKSQNG